MMARHHSSSHLAARSSKLALARPRPLLSPSTFPSEDALNQVRPFCVSVWGNPTNRPLRLATTEVQPVEESGQIVTFAIFLMAGLFLPFSDFFMGLLESYRLWMVNLSVNIVLVLVTFAHLCESFIGVMSSVCVFGGCTARPCAVGPTTLWGPFGSPSATTTSTSSRASLTR